MSDSSQDKNLPATQRKLQKAREDGQTARSRDLSHLAVLGMGSAAMLVLARPLVNHLQLALTRQLSFNEALAHNTGAMFERLQDMALVGLAASILFALLTCGAAVISAVFAGGWVYSLKPITPQFNRLNPLSGFGNLFSKQQMVNVAKMVLLSAVLATVAWKYFSGGIAQMVMTAMQPSRVGLAAVAEWLAGGMALLLLVVLVVALADVPLQSFLFKQRLKMTHEEVKQEHKDSDGNPQIKGKIRQRQREIADRSSVNATPKADFVVMNPTHYAVALRYDEATMNAPQVVAKGTDLIAFRIRDLANEHKVPVLQSPMLARALYAHADLDQPIPAQLYTAVAQVLAYVYRLKAALRGEGRMPGALPEPQVPPELDPHHRAARKPAPAPHSEPIEATQAL
ncbi:MAG: EscU/YscU/HrcU family type III secretion system export apparatus switch protein [Acidovorax sp.]